MYFFCFVFSLSANWHSPSDASLIYILIDIRENSLRFFLVSNRKVQVSLLAHWFVVICDIRVCSLAIRSQHVVEFFFSGRVFFSPLIFPFYFLTRNLCFNHLVPFSQVSRKALSFHYSDCRSLCHSTGRPHQVFFKRF